MKVENWLIRHIKNRPLYHSMGEYDPELVEKFIDTKKAFDGLGERDGVDFWLLKAKYAIFPEYAKLYLRGGGPNIREVMDFAKEIIESAGKFVGEAYH